MQNVFGLIIKDCESVVYCTQSAHKDVLAASDEFAAAFESRVAHFELYDGVRVLFSVNIVNEESIREPQESIRTIQLDAREFLQPVAAQSMHAHRLVRIRVCHRDERVAAARRREPVVLFGHVDAVKARNARAALHTEQLQIRGNTLADEHSRVTQRASDLSSSEGLHVAPLAAVAVQCHKPVGILPVQLREPFFTQTHKQYVRVAHVADTEHEWWRVVCGFVHVAQVAGVVAHSHRAHYFVVVIHEEQLVARRVVAYPPYVWIILAGSDERLIRDAANEF